MKYFTNTLKAWILFLPLIMLVACKGSNVSKSNNPDKDAPTAMSLTVPSLTEDTESIINLGYSDTKNEHATSCNITSVSNVVVGQACSCDSSGICTVGIKGLPDFNGSAKFKYTISKSGHASLPMAVNLTILPSNDAPVLALSTNSLSLPSNGSGNINATISDVDNDLNCSNLVLSSNNTTLIPTSNLTVSGPALNCVFSIKAATNQSGSGIVKVLLSDGAISTSKTINVSVEAAIDAAPVASGILNLASINEDTSGLIILGYTDANGDKATSCSVTPSNNLSILSACSCDTSGVCKVGLQGGLNFNGAASFSYNVTANGKVSNAANANLNIILVNDAPVLSLATNSISLAYNGSGSVTANASDMDSNVACSNITLSSSSTTLIPSANLSVTGTVPNCLVNLKAGSNQFGSGVVTAVLSDGQGASISKTINVTVAQPVDTAPVASGILNPTSINEETVGLIILGYTDANGDKATSCTVTPSNNLTISSACSCDTSGVCKVGLQGILNFNGAASFSYNVTANGKVSNAANANLNIISVNDAPVLSLASNSISLAYNGSGSVSANASDVDSSFSCSNITLSSSSTTLIPSANLSVTGTVPNCLVNLKAGSNQFGSGVVTAVLSDGQGASISKTINVTVAQPVDTAPIANGLISPSVILEDSFGSINLGYVDAEGDKASSCSVSVSSNLLISAPCICDTAGVCSVGLIGSANYNGNATFTYSVTANSKISNVSMATLSISPVNDLPVLKLSASTLNLNYNGSGSVSANISDVDNALNCSNISLSSSNTTNVPVNNLTITGTAPNCSIGIKSAGQSGTAIITSLLNDGSGGSDSKTINVTISPDSAPVASGVLSPTSLNQETSGQITLGYSDSDGDKAAACAVTPSSNLNITSSCTCDSSGICKVGLMGISGFYGLTNFNYTVTTNSKISNSISTSINVVQVATAAIPISGNQTILSGTSNVYSVTSPIANYTYTWSTDQGSLVNGSGPSVTLQSPTLTTQETYKQVKLSLRCVDNLGAITLTNYPVIVVKNIPVSTGLTNNFIFNGSFELGAAGFELNKHMNPSFNTTMTFDPMLIGTGPATNSGLQVLQLPNTRSDALELLSKSFPLVLGNTYNFSAYIKTNSASSVNAFVMILSSDWKVTGSTYIAVTNTWKRIHFNFTASSYNSNFTDFALNLRSNWEYNTPSNTIFLDQIKITSGPSDNANYVAQAEVEVAAISTKKLYIDNESIEVSIVANNNTNREVHGSLSLALEEDESRAAKVNLESWPVILAANEKKVFSKTITTNRFASYTLTPVATFDATSSVLPSWFSKVGKYQTSSTPVSLTNNFVVGFNSAFFQTGPAHSLVSNNESFDQYAYYLSAMGTRVARLWDQDHFAWPRIETSQDNYDFSITDFIVNKLYSNGIQPFPVIAGAPFLRDILKSSAYPNCPDVSDFEYAPEWLVPLSTDVSKPSNYFLKNCLISSNPPMQLWKNRVDTIVNRYKSKVKYWEINNEANLFAPITDYVPYLKTASQEIKTIDPSAKVVGFCFNMGDATNISYLNNATAKEGLAVSDIFSFHPYSAYALGANGPGLIPADTAISNLKNRLSGLGSSGMTLWTSEDYYLADPNQVVPNANGNGTSRVVKPRHVAQRFLTDLGEGVSQSMPVLSLGTLWRQTLNPNFPYFFQSSWTPSSIFVAYNALARMFEGATPVSNKKWNSKSVCYVYEKAGHPLAACWLYAQNAPNSNLKISGTTALTSYDLWGNVVGIPSTSFGITSEPIYLVPDASVSTATFKNLILNATML